MAITAFLSSRPSTRPFVDGLDGLASGIVAIGGIAFAIYSYIIARSSPSYASMATLIDIAMVGTCVGFILHNWHPAKLFMGDSGSMLLGYLITCASIVMTGRLDPASIHASIYLPVFMPILLPMLVLFLPILDMCLAIDGKIAVQHADAAVTGHGDGHVGLGDGVHRGGDRRDLHRDVAGEMGGGVHFGRNDVRLVRQQQHIVIGEAKLGENRREWGERGICIHIRNCSHRPTI